MKKKSLLEKFGIDLRWKVGSFDFHLLNRIGHKEHFNVSVISSMNVMKTE